MSIYFTVIFSLMSSYQVVEIFFFDFSENDCSQLVGNSSLHDMKRTNFLFNNNEHPSLLDESEISSFLKARLEKQQHLNGTGYVCEICNKVLRSQGSLNMHRRTHRPPQFFCPICDYPATHNQAHGSLTSTPI